VLTTIQSGLDAARALYEESLAIWRRLEDRMGIATGLRHLGYLAVSQWDPTTARPLKIPVAAASSTVPPTTPPSSVPVHPPES
jgi:hypothetical protein